VTLLRRLICGSVRQRLSSAVDNLGCAATGAECARCGMRMNPGEAVGAMIQQDVAEWVLSLPVVKAFGLNFEELGNGRNVTRLARHPRHSHTPGAFQATAAASLADFTGASAAMTLLPTGWAAATMDYTVKLLTEARGERLVARGRVLRAGSTVTVSAVDVYAIAGDTATCCTTALVTIRNIDTTSTR